MPSQRRPLDRTDLRILTVLADDGRITVQALAERVHLSPRACLDRVRRLERERVITGYAALIAPDAVGRCVTVVAEVSLRDQRADIQRRFEDRVRATPEVVACFLVSGAFDYLVRLVCRDLEHYRRLTSEWIDDPALGVARVVSCPELHTVKNVVGPPPAVLAP